MIVEYELRLKLFFLRTLKINIHCLLSFVDNDKKSVVSLIVSELPTISI